MGRAGDTAAGAAGGAISGAGVGTMILPGWGTAIGAGVGGVLGGLGGYFGSDDGGGGGPSADPRMHNRDQIQTAIDYTLGDLTNPRAAPQAGGAPRLGQVALGQAAQLSPAQQAQVRTQQMAQANRLGAIAAGQAQGAGELAAQRQAARQVAQQQALARLGRGVSGATMARGAARNVADIGANAAGQAQVAALQDQMNAGGQLGQLLGQMRGQDLDLAGQNAQLQQQRMLQLGAFDQQRLMQQGQMDQQTQLANLDAQLRMVGYNDAQRAQLIGQMLQFGQSEMSARLGQEQAMLQNQAATQQPSLLGPLLQMGGQLGAAYISSGKGGGG